MIATTAAPEDYRPTPIPVELAKPVQVLETEYFGLPERTVDGPVCGFCAGNEREYAAFGKTRHASAAHVRLCYSVHSRMEDEIRAEQATERAVERFFEEGPHGGYYAGSEEEARDRWNDSLRGL